MSAESALGAWILFRMIQMTYPVLQIRGLRIPAILQAWPGYP